MIKILLLLLLFSTSSYSQDGSSFTISEANRASYKTHTRYKTRKIPDLVSSDNLLKNIDKSHWTLKFYSHPDVALYDHIDLYFDNNSISIEIVDFNDDIVSKSTHHLNPVKMLKPNEGIFAYSDTNGQIHFIYLHLLLPYLLALKIVDTYEKAEVVSSQSLTELGIFTLY